MRIIVYLGTGGVGKTSVAAATAMAVAKTGSKAMVITTDPALRLRNARHRGKTAPLETACPCYTCRNFSRAYLHHLFQVDEMLGPTLLSIHNIAFYLRLMSEIRTAIFEKRFDGYRASFLRNQTPAREEEP